MLLRVLAAGTRLPSWLDEGFNDYAKRLKGLYRLELVEIPLGIRTEKSTAQATAAEGAKFLAKISPDAYVVTLEVTGKSFTTERLASFIEQRALTHRQIDFCIGGPEGLAAPVVERADASWSLSALTLPHGLARVVAAEALYRAVTVINRLPYHRP
jgi:23S rRNA (pseudouridine1915-N3)-methyltransferase